MTERSKSEGGFPFSDRDLTPTLTPSGSLTPPLSLLEFEDQNPLRQLRTILRAVANAITTTNRNLEQVAAVIRSTPEHTDQAAELLRGVEHTVELMAGLMQMVHDICNLLESNSALTAQNNALRFQMRED